MSDFVKNLIQKATEDANKGVNRFIGKINLSSINNPNRPDEMYGAVFEFAVPVVKELQEQATTEVKINNTIDEVVQLMLIRALELLPDLLVPGQYLKRFAEEMSAIVHRIVTNDPIYRPYFYTKEEFSKLVEKDPYGAHTKLMVQIDFLILMRTYNGKSRPYFTVSGKTRKVLKENGHTKMGAIIEEVKLGKKR